MYYLLTESFKANEQKLVSIIQKAVAVDKIFMLGSTLSSNRTESVFMPDAPSSRNVGHYWLLVLVDKASNKNQVQDRIENNCRHFIAVTAIVLHTQEFDGWLLQGHPFACTVVQRAVMLCDASQLPLAAAASLQWVAEKENGFNKPAEFMAGAELYLLRQQFKMAAFMLHQAAEHALHDAFKKATGLYMNTHNIDKLLRYTAMLNYRVAAVFNSADESDMALLKMLQSAYIDTRYKDGPLPKPTQLTALFAKVNTLIALLAEKSSAQGIVVQ